MEEKASSKPSMVSRLPKFGARPSGGTTVPVANGSAQATPSSEGKSEPTGKLNGLVRASSFSLKWRKENGSPVQPASPEQGSTAGEKVERGRGPPHGSPGLREIKKPATPVTKARRFGTVPVTISSPKAIPKQASKRSPSPKPMPKQSPSNHPASPQSNGARPTQNGSSSSSSTGPGRGSGLLRPRASSSSPRSSSRDSLSQSSDSLKTLAHSPSSSDSMVRSQSFTNFKQLPTGEHIPRSFSFNRAVELAKPLANTQLRPPVLRTQHVLANGRTSGQQQLGKGGFLERPSALGAAGSATPPSALRKPLLPNCVLTKPSGLAYRLTRSAGNKPQRPLLAGRMAGDGKAEEGRGSEPATDSEVSPLTSPDFSADSDKVLCLDNPSEDHSNQREKDPSLSCPGEVLEDMSLSSASSLDRNDTSEEFLDDNLGDQSHDGTPDNRQRLASSSQARLRSFLNETMDWTGGKADYGVQAPRPPLAESPEHDFPPGSSLELSPSNSSGGTYMWDEEGLEPMGHNSHCCGSYDSEGICGDILSNLDNLESCDLEDDDLMLDVDLSEDVSLCNDADGMAHFERSDRGGRQGHWRRRQHRLNGPDHFHNDNSRPVAYDGVCRVGPRALQQPAGRGDGHMVALDELTVKHMSQDCTFVKNQLLKLKSLLQLEDGPAIPDSPESIEDSSALQLQELMREVQGLREELRCKDRTIAQLTQQQYLHKQQQQTAAVRCHCQQRAGASRVDRRAHHDKSTQTPWRGPAPPVLQPSSTSPSRPHTTGSLARTAHTGDRSDLRPAGVESHGQSASTLELDGAVTTALRSLPDPEELSVLLSRHLKIHDSEAPPPSRPRSLGHPPSLERPPGEGALQGSRSLTQLPLSPRVLQPPRVHKRVSIPVLTQGDSSRASSDCVAKPSLKPGFAANSRQLKQLPPPSRGLPCFNSGPQGGGPSLATMLLGQPKPLGLRREPTHIQVEKDTGLSPRTRTLVPINLLTRFPKLSKAAAQDPEFGPRKSLEEILQAKDLPRTKLT
ncbi:serine-rich coiled-coil domain-containing protein 2 isoform X1 [Alosa alosa]|uniref:serine-rich coiled-coil domain-containing protein 2 isoform X1 n=1 Tax=Alosa alosa TaxID=278164 RepID=UPI0020154553|nr:serine-rich coiled-coil domain-containing protein 2 isoform X1 [Alosa alosa]XP_048125241.1 serine-rich coiled-coil domain-containing protein 2 isoform X1 [Alosa alosa]